LASFAPNTGVDPGREYDFKGAEPNLGLATLIKGAARISDDAINAGYKLVESDIEQRAIQGEDAIQQNLFATSDLAAAQSSTTNAGVAAPEELSRGVGKMQQLKRLNQALLLLLASLVKRCTIKLCRLLELTTRRCTLTPITLLSMFSSTSLKTA